MRRAIGGWEQQQEAAGLLARALAVAMARTHLLARHDVVVPQYVARHEFIDELAATAGSVGGRFFEVYLTDDEKAALARFEARAGDALLAEHHAEAVRNAGGPHGFAVMFDRIDQTRNSRPNAITVRTVAGDVERAYRDLASTLDAEDEE